LLALDLDGPFPAAELIDDGFEDGDEDDISPARVLKVCQPRDHFTGVKPVGAADIFLPALGRGLGLLLGPPETQARGDGDRVDEIGVESIEPHVLESRTNSLLMRFT